MRCLFVLLFVLQLSSVLNSRNPELRKFIYPTIRKHRKYRKLHSQRRYRWDSQLTKIAKRWCAHLAAKNKFKHSPNAQNYGENLYVAIRGGFKRPLKTKEAVARATRRWWSEIFMYDFDRPSFQKGTGHFTQVTTISFLTFKYQLRFGY